MSFGDKHLDAALDRWLTTEPESDWDEDWCGCPVDACSFEGTTADMAAHVAGGIHNQDYALGDD